MQSLKFSQPSLEGQQLAMCAAMSLKYSQPYLDRQQLAMCAARCPGQVLSHTHSVTEPYPLSTRGESYDMKKAWVGGENKCRAALLN